MRKSGDEVWEYRFRSKSEPGSPMRQITLSVTQYPTEKKARVALQAQLLEINGAETFMEHNEPTFDVVIDRYIQRAAQVNDQAVLGEGKMGQVDRGKLRASEGASVANKNGRLVPKA
jgi:hypothetical protein